jgi:hypothetical protein
LLAQPAELSQTITVMLALVVYELLDAHDDGALGEGSRVICGGERISTTSAVCSAWGGHWLAALPANPRARRVDRRTCQAIRRPPASTEIAIP